MAKFKKQFDIINKIKSFVKGRSEYKYSKSDNLTISEKDAKKIQFSEYEHITNKDSEDVFTHPYLIIEEQLYVEDNQVFIAAVYNLAKIAKSVEEYNKPILKILKKAREENKKDDKRTEYILKKISEIKKKQL